MKRISLLVILTLWAVINSPGQAPEMFNYQAIVRDISGNPLSTQAIKIRISILKGSTSGNVIYSEEHLSSTDQFGIITIAVGNGTNKYGDFTAISWGEDTFFLKTDVDPNDSGSFFEMGTTQLLSVPYAMFAQKSGDGFSGNFEDLTNKPANLSEFNNDVGYLTEELDGSVVNEIQQLSIIENTIHLSGGGEITLPVFIKYTQILDDSLFVTYSDGQVINVGYVGTGKPGSVLSSVTTENVSSVGYTNAILTGNVTNAGNEFILFRGFCYSTSTLPSLNDSYVTSGSGSGDFSSEIRDLLPGIKYYVRSFATNSVGTAYGNEVSFSTKASTLPVLSTIPVYNISHTSALGGGEITDNGGSQIIEKGICWSLNQYPVFEDNHVSVDSGQDSFIALMTELTPGTSYYVRAYAINSTGIAYGDEKTFTTTSFALASVNTTQVTSILYTTAIVGGEVISDNGSPVITRGFCWSTNPLPTTDDLKISENGSVGTYSATISALLPNTNYYVRAYAVSEAGTAYGAALSFSTISLSVPILSTKPISSISSNIAGSGGDFSADGGSPIVEKGVCWSLNPTPTINNNKSSDGEGLIDYFSTLTDLNPLTTYFVRAYATNATGTGYGNEISFTTTDLIYPGPSVPTVGTSLSEVTSGTTASSGGYVSSDGGSSVIARGICWSTINSSPTLSDNFTVDGNGLGYFTSNIDGISGCGTQYYIRAYATNSTGTGYGNQTSVTSGLMPVLNTNEISNISYYTATAGGTITDDGGCEISQKGVCWNYNPGPTISNPHTTDGPGGGTFTSEITGLYANRTYYVRAYATNSKGTSYGPEVVFTTTTPSTPYLGQNYAGGIVFYLDESGEHGLVCTSTDIGNVQWGCKGTSILTETAFGTGNSNTAAIVASCTEVNIAAKLCDNLSLNGYSDWYLPSKDELALIYTNLKMQNIGSFTLYVYWSSSQYDLNNAWFKDFYDGTWYYTRYGLGKDYPCYVRAIRSF